MWTSIATADSALVSSIMSAAGMEESLTRLLLCFFAALALALVYHLVVRHLPVVLKHIYNGGIGLAFCYYIFGMVGVAHTFATTAATYIILLTVGHFSRFASLCAVFAVNFGHLLVCYWYMQTEKYDIDFTLPQCVLCLRLTSLAFDYYDGSFAVATLKTDQLKNRLPTLPSPVAVIGFAFYFAAFLSGPQFTFRRYADFIDDSLTKKAAESIAKKDDDGKTAAASVTTAAAPSGALPYALKCVGLALFWFALNQYLTSLNNKTSDLFDKYAASLATPHPAASSETIIASILDWRRWGPVAGTVDWRFLFSLIVAGNVVFMKYYGVWLLAEAACVLTGISFNGYDKISGAASWDGLTNIRPLRFILAENHGACIANFNVNTNDWAKRYVFKRLMFLKNKQASSLGTLFVLAIWHGFYTGYMITFLLEFFVVDAERKFASVTSGLNRRLYAPDASIATRLVGFVWSFFTWACRMSFSSMCIIPFDIKQGARAVAFMNAVAWAPLTLSAIMMLLFPLLRPLTQEPKKTSGKNAVTLKKEA